jgi:hypothetical protein
MTIEKVLTWAAAVLFCILFWATVFWAAWRVWP